MIPYGRQDVSEEDIAAVVEVLRSDWLTTGPAVEKFEQDLEQWTGGVSVAAVSSGTAALHAAYFAAGIGPGDEVIAPPITFIATQATARLLGADIVFADVCEDTANIDPVSVEAHVNSRTKAIVAVDFAGHPADMEALREIADKHGLVLIQDAAHSLGSTYNGKPVGSLADLTAFSFFPTKNMTSAEGGAVAAKDRQMLERARSFARQGLERDPEKQVIRDQGPWHQEAPIFGLNYRLPDVLASLGSSQLRRLGMFKEYRTRTKVRYDEKLERVQKFRVPAQRANVDPVWHLYPLRVPAESRTRIFNSCRAAGIGVQVNYMPAYWHPAFDAHEYPRGLCANAEKFYACEISLPIHTRLTDDDQDYVIDVLLRESGNL